MIFSERFAAWVNRVPYKFTKYSSQVDTWDSSAMLTLRSETYHATIACYDDPNETAHFSITKIDDQTLVMSRVTHGALSFMWSFSIFFNNLGIHVDGCQPLLPGIVELKAAIDEVLGADSSKIRCALQKHTSPFETTKWMHQHACVAAFGKKLEGPSVDVLRELLVYLNQHGNYPIDSWEMACR